jgi:hypothetical protein
VAAEPNVAGALAGTWRCRIEAADVGWIAARAWGRARTSYGHAQWAHTSPVSLRATAGAMSRRTAATGFVAGIDAALDWVRSKGRFADDGQRQRIHDLFGEGRAFYQRLADPGA